MERTSGSLLCLIITGVLIISACGPELSAPPQAPASATPDLAQTALANTLTAAPTATYTSPPPTPVPTITRTPYPTITPIPSLTPIPSFTPLGQESTAGPGDGSSGPTSTPPSGEFSCQLVSKSPDNWDVFKPRYTFDAVWKLKNTGTKMWKAGQIAFVFVSGAKLNSGPKSYPLVSDVNPGETGSFTVDMIAPKEEGRYYATWGLLFTRLNNLYCSVAIRITVSK